MAIASGLAGVLEIGPVFRAEDSRSSRHLTEFTGLDIEFSWAFETEDVMQLEAQMLRFAFAKLAPFAPEVQRHFGVELPLDPSLAFLTLDAAKAVLAEHGMMLAPDDDLPDEGERMLYMRAAKRFDLCLRLPHRQASVLSRLRPHHWHDTQLRPDFQRRGDHYRCNP